MSSAATTVRRSRRVDLPIFEALTILGLIGIAWIHLLDLGDKMEETPYLGVAYIGLIAGCIAAAVLLARGDRRGFLLAGGLAGATFIGYCLSRTTGRPAPPAAAAPRGGGRPGPPAPAAPAGRGGGGGAAPAPAPRGDRPPPPPPADPQAAGPAAAGGYATTPLSGPARVSSAAGG